MSPSVQYNGQVSKYWTLVQYLAFEWRSFSLKNRESFEQTRPARMRQNRPLSAADISSGKHLKKNNKQ